MTKTVRAVLRGVTLVVLDGTTPELARLSLLDSLEQVKCDEVLVCSPADLGIPGTRWHHAEPWGDRLAAQQFLWHELHELLVTDHFLMTSWDSWVLDGWLWSAEYLRYDYLGAPWWYDDGLNVGHGTLRSRRLMRFLSENCERFPLLHPEDDTISRRYRRALEAENFAWPDERTASRFMLECTRPSPESRHFMFHDAFNFPAVLGAERLAERVALMERDPRLARKLGELRTRRALVMPRLAS